jgi:transposase
MNTTSYYAGIDVSKAFLDLHLLPSEQAERFPNDAAGHHQLIGLLQKHRVQLIVLDYERAAVSAMVQAGLRVHVAQPQIIRAFAVSMKIRAKNDDLDSGVCARYAQDRAKELSVIASIDPTRQTLQALLVRRSQLVEMATLEQNRLQQVSDRPALQSVKRSLKFLQKHRRRTKTRPQRPLHGVPVRRPHQPGHPAVLQQAPRARTRPQNRHDGLYSKTAQLPQ